MDFYSRVKIFVFSHFTIPTDTYSTRVSSIGNTQEILGHPSVNGIRERSSPVSAPSASNVSDVTLTCKDGTVFPMGEFMKLMMEQLKTTNKVLSKGEESESKKRLRLAEAEVM